MRKTLVIHPIFIAIFPILSLFDHNKDLLNIDNIVLPLVTVYIFVTLIFFTIQFFLKNIYKTGLITSLFFVLFFLFGHVNNLFMPYVKIGEFYIKGLDYVLLSVVFLFFFFIVSKELWLNKKSFIFATQFINKVSFFLVLLPLVSIFLYSTGNHTVRALGPELEEKEQQDNDGFLEKTPDIYYIILDAYARDDVLEKYFKFDNSGFYELLEEKGFFVARKSTSNYSQTYLSLSSSLNMEYVNYLTKQLENTTDRGYLREMIKNNKVYDVLKAKGYKFVEMPPMWWGVTDNLKSDIKFDDKKRINDFESLVLRLTPLSKIFNKKINIDFKRSRIKYNFEHIPDITEIDGPTFSYVHFLTPHPPFLFDAQGLEVYPGSNFEGLDGEKYFKEHPSKEEYVKKYRDMIVFANQNIIEMVSRILEQSSTQPIIILQADHGSGFTLESEHPELTDMKERMSIFNAYYVSEDIKNDLYPKISPVNSFRIILSHLFDINYDLLPDKNYFSKWSEPYSFIDVSEKVGN